MGSVLLVSGPACMVSGGGFGAGRELGSCLWRRNGRGPVGLDITQVSEGCSLPSCNSCLFSSQLKTWAVEQLLSGQASSSGLHQKKEEWH